MIVFAKPIEKRKFMIKALSSHPRKLAKVLILDRSSIPKNL